jgi:hypothetical protein
MPLGYAAIYGTYTDEDKQALTDIHRSLVAQGITGPDGTPLSKLKHVLPAVDPDLETPEFLKNIKNE